MTALPAFGRPVRALFDYDPAYHPLNHGSFGTAPTAVREARARYLAAHEARPDIWRRFEEPGLEVRARAAVAPLLGPDVHVDEVVIVANATTGTNAVIQNVAVTRGWSAADGDTAMHLSLIYDACRKTLEAAEEAGRLRIVAVAVDVRDPAGDAAIVQSVRNAHAAAVDAGLHPRLLVFDTVASMPGVRLPWESLVALARELDMLSLVDGAHGIGLLDLQRLGAPDLQPDFFVTNCHKWLFTPRGCALLYVPFRHQHLIASSVPTSHGYRPPHARPPQAGPATAETPNYFVGLFANVGTTDRSPFLCIPDALAFRQDVCGGEVAIRDYCIRLARTGGDRVAAILGTEVLDNPHPDSRLRESPLVNVRLPLAVRADAALAATPDPEAIPLSQLPVFWAWFESQQTERFNTFVPVVLYEGQLWARFSAQIYLDEEDFVWGGNMLLDLCKTAQRGEWKRKTE